MGTSPDQEWEGDRAERRGLAGRNWPGTNLGPFVAQAPRAPLSEHPDNLGRLSSTLTAAVCWHSPPPASVQSTGQMESPHPTSQASPQPGFQILKTAKTFKWLCMKCCPASFCLKDSSCPSPQPPPHPLNNFCAKMKRRPQAVGAPGHRGCCSGARAQGG